MSKRPLRPTPGPTDDQVVVIVKKRNSAGMSTLCIAVLLAAGVFWLSQGGQSKAQVPAKAVAPAANPAAAIPPMPAIHPVKAVANEVAPALPSGPFGRPAATFFEPTPEEEPAPEAP